MWQLNLSDGKLHHITGTGQAGYASDGGPATEAKFNGPKGIAVAHGKVFVADTENNAIRQIDVKSGVATVDSKGTKFNPAHGPLALADGAYSSGDTLNHRLVPARQFH